ncbi:MAG: DNA polymerase III subunit delta [Eubacterium sp.]|nr:DNA polymerase III subunit delta [Eubacterium sp.]MBQ9023048.1 DNA polymerase III subunit delta [Eubacterium sp.]
MEKLTAEIKNKDFKRVYLFYGEEKYLIRQYQNRLVEAVLGENAGMNLSVFEGKNADPKEIMSQAQTMPFFADYRVILVQESGFYKKTPEGLAEYLSEIPDTAILLFVESEVDKRSKMYKQTEKNGRAVQFTRQKDAVLKKWILSQLKKEGKKITEPVMNAFLECTGDDMELISQELEKLLCYTMEKDVISAEDVKAVCVPSVGNHIFDMIDALAAKNRQRAMDLYLDLLRLREPPMRILYLIGRQFYILNRLKSMRKTGIGDREMASAVKIPPFAVKKNLAQAAKFTDEQIQETIETCVQADADVKSGHLSDRMAVELVMTTIAGL